MKRRPRRSVPATLVAIVLLACCALVAVAAIQTIIGDPPWLSYRAAVDALHTAHWSDPVPAIAGGPAALLGLVLLLSAILPGKPTVLPLRGELNSGASRRSYRNTLRAAANKVDGVSTARLKLKRRKAIAIVNTSRTDPDGLAEAVRAAIEHRIDQITPLTPPKITVRVKAARSTS